ncbi:hypothetical protein K1T71_006413 [Dendrolimus kikuchii]|uniref:Uncharacterized protein n=1 Tax=Dendrolimus kikuchii TaxID=765133 RepID=A0ACC1D0Y1_9NEOP|nr:hypothetical protein K1T71_006413 [Dendrolimus kikuchii]
MLITTSLGVIFIILSVLLLTLDPIQFIIKYNTRIVNGSFMMDTFQSEVEGARLSISIFNVTNAERFMAGEDYKLKVEEIGPFTYVEYRSNIVLDLKPDVGLMSFTPTMNLKFLPNESIADPRSMNITVPNIALLSASTLLSSQPSWIQKGFNILVHHLRSQAMISLDVHSYLWGFHDPLIGLANTLVPGLIYFDKFGIIDRLYENKTLYHMEVGITDKDRFSIKTLKKYIKQKDYDKQEPLESYKFENTYEGVVYPPNFSKEMPIKIYRIGVCRPFELEYQETRTEEYVPEVLVYKISNNTFAKDCEKTACGMLDLSACTYGIPIAMSRTHFLHSDPKLYERMEGISPDEAKHDSAFSIDPKLGFTLTTRLSLQLNIMLKDVSFNDQTKSFSNMIIPVAYINVVQPELLDDFKSLLKLVYKTFLPPGHSQERCGLRRVVRRGKRYRQRVLRCDLRRGKTRTARGGDELCDVRVKQIVLANIEAATAQSGVRSGIGGRIEASRDRNK